MMLLLLLAQAAAAPAAPPEDVVVVAARLRHARFSTRRDPRTGRFACTVRRSTGLVALDAALCDATLACAAVETARAGMERCMTTRVTAIMTRFGTSAATPAVPPLPAPPPPTASH